MAPAYPCRLTDRSAVLVECIGVPRAQHQVEPALSCPVPAQVQRQFSRCGVHGPRGDPASCGSDAWRVGHRDIVQADPSTAVRRAMVFSIRTGADRAPPAGVTANDRAVDDPCSKPGRRGNACCPRRPVQTGAATMAGGWNGRHRTCPRGRVRLRTRMGMDTGVCGPSLPS